MLQSNPDVLERLDRLIQQVDGPAGTALRQEWDRLRQDIAHPTAQPAETAPPDRATKLNRSAFDTSADPETDAPACGAAGASSGDRPASNKHTRQQIAAYLSAAGDFGRLLINSSLDMIIAVDLLMRIVEFNPAAEETLGYTKAEMLGQSIETLYADPQNGWKIRSNAFRGGYVGRVWNRRKNGEVFPARLTARLMRDADDEVIGLMGISRDISVEVRAEEELLQRTRDLEAARARADAEASAKNLFLAHVNHELRTPMTAILGFAEELLRPDLGESERHAAAETIHRNGEYLLSIMNDILDMSKVEAGKLSVELRRCAPTELVNDVVELMRGRAAAAGLDLSLRWRGEIPDTIETDSTRLRQILINLLANAIKFTAAGGVRLSVRLDRSAGATLIRFDVLDSGIGIRPEHAAAIFEPFTQADTSMARRFGGTGLGLAISRRLARLLGGDVTVMRTRNDRGTCFRATVPTGSLAGVPLRRWSSQEPAPRPRARSTAPAARLHGHILLAEDGPDNQRLIAFMLRRAGADVTIVSNGREAVEAALAAERGQRHGDPLRPFDVILMDMQMPVLDGYEAARELRTRGYRRPIIALTAHAMTGDRERCLAAGCDEFATKPLDRAALLSTIQRHLRPRDASAFMPDEPTARRSAAVLHEETR